VARLNTEIEHNIFEVIRMLDKEKRNLLIGVCKDLTFDQLKPFVKSAREYIDKDTTHFVMISIDDKTGLNGNLIGEGWSVVPLDINSREQIHMERFKYVNEYLQRYPNYDKVISCDVRDIIFQADPFICMNGIFADAYQHDRIEYSAIVNLEGIQVKNEEWNRNNILNCFGPVWLNRVKDYEVMNVGILAGNAQYISDTCMMIYMMSQNRNDWVSDQAAYNVLGDMMGFNSVNYYPHEYDNWSVNLHITHKPDCKERLKPYWTRQPAQFIDGVVYNVIEDEDDYFPYCIVHQYDRDETMLKYFVNKYK
jgi:hypothetical protein